MKLMLIVLSTSLLVSAFVSGSSFSADNSIDVKSLVACRCCDK